MKEGGGDSTPCLSVETGMPYIQIWNIFTFNSKIKNLSVTLQREIFFFLKKPVLRVFESLLNRDLVDSESPTV